jgi:chorismate mutase
MDLVTRYPIDAVVSVDSGRALLDQIDDELLAVLEHRRQVSVVVQGIRRAGGGARVLYTRENEIIQRYSQTVGSVGAELALLVLKYCRGAAPTDRVAGMDPPP